MNRFHQDYKTVAKSVPGKLAKELRKLLSGDYKVDTYDVRAFKKIDNSYNLQYLPISSNGQPDLTGHTLQGVVSSLTGVENLVSALAMSPNINQEIRVIKGLCDDKEIYVVLVDRSR